MLEGGDRDGPDYCDYLKLDVMVLELEMEGKLQPPLSTMLVITRGAIVMIKIFPNWMRMIIISLNIAETEMDEKGGMTVCCFFHLHWKA